MRSPRRSVFMFAGRIGMLSKARADEARGFAVWIPV